MDSLRIGKWEVPIPIIQGGMGVGLSWEKLAGSVAREGAIGVVSAVGTGYRFPEMVITCFSPRIGIANIEELEHNILNVES